MHCVNKWMFSGDLRLFICARLVELLETGTLNHQKRFPSEQKNSKVLGQEIGSLSENHPYMGHSQKVILKFSEISVESSVDFFCLYAN